jgi:hypothetical protein
LARWRRGTGRARVRRGHWATARGLYRAGGRSSVLRPAASEQYCVRAEPTHPQRTRRRGRDTARERSPRGDRSPYRASSPRPAGTAGPRPSRTTGWWRHDRQRAARRCDRAHRVGTARTFHAGRRALRSRSPQEVKRCGQSERVMGGSSKVPSKTALSGEYMRRIGRKVPAGAGSQFAARSGSDGASRWMTMVSEPSSA